MLTDKSTIEVIKKSRKLVTILFSDIEHSTRHWERRGDIDARLLLDRHNRLLFPIIRKFKGKIIKTLGDAIMASFNLAENAVKAGIAIQQRLHEERHNDKYFSLRTRIGIHTGTGIVEYDDIFGDVVNVASKVESSAQPNQILLTHSTLARISASNFELNETTRLKVIGRRKVIPLYICHWENHKNLVAQIKPDVIMPLLKSQKLELISYVVVTLLAVFFSYQFYLRYLLQDVNLSPSWFQNTALLPSDYPVILILQILTLVGFSFYLLRIDFISRALLRTLSGLFTAGLTVLIMAGIINNFDLPFNKRWQQPIYQSNHEFIEVISDNIALRSEPEKNSQVLKVLPKGELFIYMTSKTINNLTWDQVQLGNNKSGWLAQKILPAFGVAEEPLTSRKKFYFRYYDLYGLLAGLFSFVWGFLSFSIRPS